MAAFVGSHALALRGGVRGGGSCLATTVHPLRAVHVARVRPHNGRRAAPRMSAAPEEEWQISPRDLGNFARDACLTATSLLSMAMVAMPSEALAEDGGTLRELFKTKALSLIHPAAMWTLLASSLYAFYLGYQSRRIRSADSELKKELVKGKFGDRHFKFAALILAFVTIATFEGMANTYVRAGKLFPGPHLYNGLTLVASLATMAALSPYMLKGKLWAKQAHFSLSFVTLGLFFWQANTGLKIVSKLLGWS